MKSRLDNLFHILLVYLKIVLRRRSVWTRALLCWLIGLLALSNDEVKSYDTRFQARPTKEASKDIVIIQIHASDLLRQQDARTKSLISVNEMMDLTDGFFWDQQLWSEFLTKLLEYNPKSVAITLHLPESAASHQSSKSISKVFFDPKIYWASTKNQLERLSVPPFSRQNLSNVGISEVPKDDDGVTRRVFTDLTDIPHLAERISNKRFPRTTTQSLSINYVHNAKSIPHYSLSDLLQNEIPREELENKIIIIGAETSYGNTVQTPIGSLRQTEVLAQLTDNLLNERWIQRLPSFAYAIILLIFTIVSAVLITRYPHSVAIIFLLWLSTLNAAASAWSVDTFYIWTPAFSPLVVFGSSWIIFIGYQTSQIERTNIKLQQEKKSLEELEQLKNNFVSLISHDLKTPIAKIQAVTGRLLSENKGAPIETDLQSLHHSSEELNKYIQSILKVLRVESRDFKINREVADINEVIEEVITSLTPLAKEKKISLNLQLEPMFSSEFDITLMKEVILNIIENAIKYSNENSEVVIKSEEIENKIFVSVQDFGNGISDEELENVWGKFVRGKDQDLKTKGSGLGLYLVKYFIELHGGEVSLISKVGLGSTVSFTLPVYDDTHLADHPSANKEEQT